MRNSTSLHFLIFATATDFRIRKAGRTFKYRIFSPVANNIGIKFPKIQTAPVKIPKELFKKTDAEPKNLLFSPKFFAFTLAFIVFHDVGYTFRRTKTILSPLAFI